MSFLRNFTRRKADPDQMVLNQLAKHGAKLTQPRVIDLFIYFPSQEGVDAVVDKLAAIGASASTSNDAKRGFCVKGELLIIPELAALQRIRLDLVGLASKHGGEYDGWGTMIAPDEQ